MIPRKGLIPKDHRRVLLEIRRNRPYFDVMLRISLNFSTANCKLRYVELIKESCCLRNNSERGPQNSLKTKTAPLFWSIICTHRHTALNTPTILSLRKINKYRRKQTFNENRKLSQTRQSRGVVLPRSARKPHIQLISTAHTRFDRVAECA